MEISEIVNQVLQAVGNFNLNASNPVVIGVLCAVSCVGIFVLGFVLQFLGGIIQFFASIIGVFFDVLSGGPIAWCGCLVFIMGSCGCLVFVLAGFAVMSTCGTPQQVNLCRFLGY